MLHVGVLTKIGSSFNNIPRIFSPHVVLAAGGGRGGSSEGLVSEPRLSAPLPPQAGHAGASGPLGGKEEIVITVTEASDDELEDVGRRVVER